VLQAAEDTKKKTSPSCWRPLRRALVPRQATFALSSNGTCVARSTRIEEDGFAGGPFLGCAGGPLP